MTRIVRAIVLCICLGSLVGCSVLKNERKTDDDKEEHKVSILGIGIWHTEKEIENPGK